MTTTSPTLADRIGAIRSAHHWTQVQCAVAFGVSLRSLKYLEAGRETLLAGPVSRTVALLEGAPGLAGLLLPKKSA